MANQSRVSDEVLTVLATGFSEYSTECSEPSLEAGRLEISPETTLALKRWNASCSYLAKLSIDAQRRFLDGAQHLISPSQNGTHDIIELVNHSLEQGRSGASVGYTSPKSKVSATTLGPASVITHEKIGRKVLVRKYDQEPELAQIEYDIYDGLRARGFSVPRVEKKGDELYVEEIDGDNLQDTIANFFLSSYWGAPIEDIFKATGENIRGAIVLGCKLDKAVSEILTPAQKDYLNQRKTRKLVERLGITDEQARASFHTYSLVACLGLGQDFITAFQPVQDAINEGMKKYGGWTSGVHPKNIILDLEGNTTTIDFNHPDETLLSTTDSYIGDCFYPVKDEKGLLIASTPFQDEEGKRTLLRGKFRLWNRGAKKPLEDEEGFVTTSYSGRIYRSAKQADHALRELQDANQEGNLLQIYYKHAEAMHYAQDVENAVREAEARGTKAPRLAALLCGRIRGLAGEFVTRETLQDAELFIKNPQGYIDKHGLGRFGIFAV